MGLSPHDPSGGRQERYCGLRPGDKGETLSSSDVDEPRSSWTQLGNGKIKRGGFLAALAASLALTVVWAAPVSASNGSQVFSAGGGGFLHGAVRTDGTGLACLGFQPTDDLGLTLVQHLGAKLTLTPSGNAQLAFHADASYAFYLNPGGNLPNPGDPGLSWSGSPVSDYSTTLTSLSPDQYGEETVTVSVPFTMTSADGSNTQLIYADFSAVIVFAGNQVSGIATTWAVPRCP